mmetsp:Transcript_14276/g.19859  ORF Transcript_14276/g.19859 Transcript_14276/m.19859 type:complete len:126 (-) Transcript_14276:384-761(-)
MLNQSNSIYRCKLLKKTFYGLSLNLLKKYFKPLSYLIKTKEIISMFQLINIAIISHTVVFENNVCKKKFLSRVKNKNHEIGIKSYSHNFLDIIATYQSNNFINLFEIPLESIINQKSYSLNKFIV